MEQDTIAAITTPLGEGGLGAIRISGPQSLNILQKIFALSSSQKLISRKLCHGWIEPEKNRRIDEVMVVYLAAPKTYTGEDVVEIFSHGGIAILQLILKIILSQGARLAQRGEFTRRAFLNGKIDLTQAEAVVGLVKAKTEEAIYLAESQLEGRLAKKIRGQRKELLDVLALVEADIDFSEDLPPLDFSFIRAKICTILGQIEALIKTSLTGEIIFGGALVSIIGRPNVGKSSLLNLLLKEDKAIVTEVPGTTRDLVEGWLNIRGIPLRLVDTAGLREVEGKDRAERAGVEKTKAISQKAALRLLVIDQSEALKKEDWEILGRADPGKTMVVFNKTDLPGRISSKNREKIQSRLAAVFVSALSGKGIDNLEEEIYNWFCASQGFSLDAETVLTTGRQRESLARSLEALQKARGAAERELAGDFIAIDLKAAVVALGEITGEEVTDEVLDRVFSEFCVGK